MIELLKNFFVCVSQVTKGNKYYFAWVTFLSLLVCFGGFFYIKQLNNGLIVTAMRDQVSWLLYIEFYISGRHRGSSSPAGCSGLYLQF